MDFENRSNASERLIELTKQHIWDNTPSLYHIEMGYETHIPDYVREALRYVRTETARYVRYAPDFLVVDNKNPDNVYLLEYKCTQTPLYSQNIINRITREAKPQPFPWQDIGRCEREAFDNYLALSKMGIRVAILYYIAYHERILLCDFVENIEVFYRDRSRGVAGQGRGSRTPILNFDANSMKTFQIFLGETHRIEIDNLTSHFENLNSQLQQQLPVIHDRNSPYARQR